MAKVEIDSNVISIDQEMVSGAPCFDGTRVPVRSLFDYLEGELSVNEFLSDFPTVTREQVHKIFRHTSASLQEIADRPYLATR